MKGGFVTHDRLRELLRYDPESGALYWHRSGSGRSANLQAGTTHRGGYRRVKIDGKSYQAHRLIWLYMFGRWPSLYVDHRNCIRDDNRIENLREATTKQNVGNRLATKKSHIPWKGVRLSRAGKYTATIVRARKKIHLGTYRSADDALAAYKAAAIAYFGEFARFA